MNGSSSVCLFGIPLPETRYPPVGGENRRYNSAKRLADHL